VSFGAQAIDDRFLYRLDESSYSSLERNLNSLDWVMPQWSHLVPAKPGESLIADDITGTTFEMEHDQAMKALEPYTSTPATDLNYPMVQNS